MYLVRATHHGTLAAPVCAIRTTPRCPNRHSVCALNTSRGVRRGFLPRGLCDTCPQVVAARRCVVRAGQVSHNPKHQLSFATGSLLDACLAAADWSLLTSYGRPRRADGYFQDVSGSKCRANSMASCSTRPTTIRAGSKR